MEGSRSVRQIPRTPLAETLCLVLRNGSDDIRGSILKRILSNFRVNGVPLSLTELEYIIIIREVLWRTNDDGVERTVLEIYETLISANEVLAENILRDIPFFVGLMNTSANKDLQKHISNFLLNYLDSHTNELLAALMTLCLDWVNLSGIFNILHECCKVNRSAILQLHQMNISATLCYALTNKFDLPQPKFELESYRHDVLVNLLRLMFDLIPVGQRQSTTSTTAERSAIGDQTSPTTTEHGGNAEQEAVMAWLDDHKEYATRTVKIFFAFAQHILLLTFEIDIHEHCLRLFLALILYDNDSWQTVLKPKEFFDKLVYVKEKCSVPFQSAIKDLMALFCEVIYSNRCQSSIQQLPMWMEILLKYNYFLLLGGKAKQESDSRDNRECRLELLKSLYPGFNDWEANEASNCIMRTAVRMLNTQDDSAVESLQQIRHNLKEHHINFIGQSNCGFVRSLLYFLTGVDVIQRAKGVPPSELQLSIDHCQKIQRNKRIKTFLSVYFDFEDGEQPMLFPGKEKPFDTLVDILLTILPLSQVHKQLCNEQLSKEQIQQENENLFEEIEPPIPSIYKDGPQNLLDEFLVPYLPGQLFIDEAWVDVVVLLRVLYGISQYYSYLYEESTSHPLVSEAKFQNEQLHYLFASHRCKIFDYDEEIYQLSMWKFLFRCSFVFSLDERRVNLNLLTSSWNAMQYGIFGDDYFTRIKVERANIMEETLSYFCKISDYRFPLLGSFKGEPGTGAGPTQEYFTLMCREFQKKVYGLWRDENVYKQESENEEYLDYVIAPHGLYPEPISLPLHSTNESVIRKFELLGKLMANCLVSEKTVDIHLHECLCKWLLKKEDLMQSPDLCSLLPEIGVSMRRFEAIVEKRNDILSNAQLTGESSTKTQEKLGELKVDGCSIEELCLDFTLPGYESIELKEGGRDTAVELSNLDQYVQLVIDYTLRKGVSCQMKALCLGFNSMFPIQILQLFTPAEIVTLFYDFAKTRNWLFRLWVEKLKVNGYDSHCETVESFKQILLSYNSEEQKSFLRFVTGSSRTPFHYGSSFVRSLTLNCYILPPKCKPDDYLPLAATCDMAVWMPQYSNADIMRSKLSTALHEGQDNILDP